MAENYKAIVVTVSDSSFQGEREDESGPLARQILTDAGIEVLESRIVPDERKEIADYLEFASDRFDVDLLITTGGTGFAGRDVTPEATLDVIEKRAEGLEELMRLESLKKTPLAALSRGVCGIRGNTLIINLPGSPKAVEENLRPVLKVIDHALILLKGGKPH